MLYAIVALLVIILDQWMKYWIAGNIVVNTGIKELIPGLISLVNVHNDGAAFSFLSGGGARIYFILICIVFTILVIIALATNWISGPVGRWSAVFVAAGGIGNCIDRVLYGYVQDMFKLEFMNFPVFNIADIFIVVFAFLFILHILFGGEKEYEDDEDEYYDDEEEDDEDDYEEERKPLFSRRASRSRRYDYDDDDDDEDDEEEDVPARPLFGRKKKEQPKESGIMAVEKPNRRARQAKYEQDYEQYKAARAARQQAAAANPQPVTAKSVPIVDPSDPFAEWERANSKVEAQKKTQTNDPFAEWESRTAPAQQPKAQPARPAVQQNRPAAQPARPAPQPKAQPAPEVPVQPAAKPVEPAPAKAPASTEFSLEDILAEFK